MKPSDDMILGVRFAARLERRSVASVFDQCQYEEPYKTAVEELGTKVAAIEKDDNGRRTTKAEQAFVEENRPTWLESVKNIKAKKQKANEAKIAKSPEMEAAKKAEAERIAAEKEAAEKAEAEQIAAEKEAAEKAEAERIAAETEATKSPPKNPPPAKR